MNGGTFGIGILIGIAVALLFVEFILRPRCEQIIRILETDRDAARQEAKVFRGALIPRLQQLENPPDTPAVTAVPEAKLLSKAAALKPAPKAPQSIDDIFKLRIPYREKFKLLTRFTNSKQRKTDALASALEKQKPIQETHHATV